MVDWVVDDDGIDLVGTHFERTDVSCGCNGDTGYTLSGERVISGDFHRNRILLREWDLWYYIAPRMSVGGSVLWYDASNLDNVRNQEAHKLRSVRACRIAAD